MYIPSTHKVDNLAGFSHIESSCPDQGEDENMAFTIMLPFLDVLIAHLGGHCTAKNLMLDAMDIKRLWVLPHGHELLKQTCRKL